MNCKERLETYLHENKVPFQAAHHPSAYTAQEVAAAEHIPGKILAKVVIAFASGKMVMLGLPASSRVSPADAGTALGVKELRLAREGEFAPVFPDCELGAMPPFGNLYGLPVYVDKALAEDEMIVFNAGTHSDTISMKYADFERLVKPTVADLAHPA